ncbi:MAG: O-antigen ligase family protein [Acidaminococcus sp.]|jgi:hypothetical protein|nr:O-antigen ligase family protein [Acidaminococcus sp.]MCI2116459.1 O-antigen ligase family protein [Acidaminococcus sp.]
MNQIDCSSKFFSILLFLSYLSLIFSYIPEKFRVTFLSNGLSMNLSWYFLFFLTVLYLVFSAKRNTLFDTFREDKNFLFYYCIFSFTLIFSNVLGFFNFPFWTEVVEAPISQLGKVPRIIDILNSKGISIPTIKLLKGYLFLKSVKVAVFYPIYTFFFSYIVYKCIYKNYDFHLKLLYRAVWSSILLIIVFSTLEVFYLCGNLTAKAVLAKIIPLIEEVQTFNNAWPPIFWKGIRMKSLFPEPSRIGNYAAFALPLAWSQILDKTQCSFWKITLISLFQFIIFMSQSRTAVALTMGLFLLLWLFLIYVREKELIKKGLLIGLLLFISFGLMLFYSNALIVKGKNVINNVVNNEEITASSYFEENFASLGTPNKRSNGPRFAYIKANFKTGCDHPFFGVGNIFNNVYALHNLQNSDFKIPEIIVHYRLYLRKGPLSGGFGAQNEYVSRFAENGLIGLSIFFVPFLYGIWILIINLRSSGGQRRIQILGVLLSLIGSIVAACNGSINIMYTAWIILAFAYAVKSNNKNVSIENSER